MARLGLAKRGMTWIPSPGDKPGINFHGVEGLSGAWRGEAWRGLARPGSAGLVTTWIPSPGDKPGTNSRCKALRC
jgi:hypothetical protein